MTPKRKCSILNKDKGNKMKMKRNLILTETVFDEIVFAFGDFIFTGEEDMDEQLEKQIRNTAKRIVELII